MCVEENEDWCCNFCDEIKVDLETQKNVVRNGFDEFQTHLETFSGLFFAANQEFTERLGNTEQQVVVSRGEIEKLRDTQVKFHENVQSAFSQICEHFRNEKERTSEQFGRCEKNVEALAEYFSQVGDTVMDIQKKIREFDAYFAHGVGVQGARTFYSPTKSPLSQGINPAFLPAFTVPLDSKVPPNVQVDVSLPSLDWDAKVHSVAPLFSWEPQMDMPGMPGQRLFSRSSPTPPLPVGLPSVTQSEPLKPETGNSEPPLQTFRGEKMEKELQNRGKGSCLVGSVDLVPERRVAPVGSAHGAVPVAFAATPAQAHMANRTQQTQHSGLPGDWRRFSEDI